MSKRGVIDVITLVLLVVIAVAAVAAVWAWMSGFLPGIFPRTTVAPEPISIASLLCNSAAAGSQISVSVRNIGSRQIPPGGWGFTVTKLNVTTGAWATICTNTVTFEALNVGAVSSTSFACSISTGDELTVTATSPQGASASLSCVAS